MDRLAWEQLQPWIELREPCRSARSPAGALRSAELLPDNLANLRASIERRFAGAAVGW
jgi:hypothetical protein